jgi:hypothetical protein
MHDSPWLRVSVIVLLAAACSGQEEPEAPAPAAPAPTSRPTIGEFARFVPKGEDEGRFETVIASYRGPDGERVDLIAAVHIADKAHYAELQREFENYEVLLYELVAEPERRPKPGDESEPGLLGMFQLMLTNALQLEFQLNAIDYTKDNFVHADLTPQGFVEKMEERGETFLSMLWKFAVRNLSLAQAEQQPMQSIVEAFQRREGRHLLRLTFARQLASLESIAAGVDPENETTLLEGRNERALEVLREQLADGKTHIGIYYGAAHMPGIERSLVEEMGFVPDGRRWLTAWDLTKRPDPKPPRRSKKD